MCNFVNIQVNLVACALLNPAENCFEQMKKVLSQEGVHAILGQNLKFPITQAMKDILQNDLISF
jgi:hypothetical protein